VLLNRNLLFPVAVRYNASVDPSVVETLNIQLIILLVLLGACCCASLIAGVVACIVIQRMRAKKAREVVMNDLLGV